MVETQNVSGYINQICEISQSLTSDSINIPTTYEEYNNLDCFERFCFNIFAGSEEFKGNKTYIDFIKGVLPNETTIYLYEDSEMKVFSSNKEELLKRLGINHQKYTHLCMKTTKTLVTDKIAYILKFELNGNLLVCENSDKQLNQNEIRNALKNVVVVNSNSLGRIAS